MADEPWLSVFHSVQLSIYSTGPSVIIGNSLVKLLTPLPRVTDLDWQAAGDGGGKHQATMWYQFWENPMVTSHLSRNCPNFWQFPRDDWCHTLVFPEVADGHFIFLPPLLRAAPGGYRDTPIKEQIFNSSCYMVLLEADLLLGIQQGR